MQQYPWGQVYISYEVVGDVAANTTKGMVPFLFVTAKNKTNGSIYATATSLPDAEPFLSGDTGTAVGQHKIVWDIGAQGKAISSAEVIISVMYCDTLYMVVDISSGSNASSYPVSYLCSIPSGGWTDAYKTTKLVFRRILPGSFKMCGAYNVTLTKPFYVGIFEVTQKQFQLVVGTNPAMYQDDAHPVENLDYRGVCGTDKGVVSSSFVGKLCARTGLNFQLPTEAQWEYACRAGTTSSYNNGGNTENDLRQLGRYSGNKGRSQHAKVGSYGPNAWGIYDMHGNVYEICMDIYSSSLNNNVTDPQGPANGPNLGLQYHVLRGGCWFDGTENCTSSYRRSSNDFYNLSQACQYMHSGPGFRLARTLVD